MIDSTKRQQVIDLLREAGDAHHRAYAETDGADVEWPIWYAEYLQQRLGALLNAQFSRSELVYVLISLDREAQRMAPGGDWRDYYARALLERYG
jgi:NAD(P)H-hydrate epimerase